jgi:uncharacterized protein YjbI with pentapeptide repeats
LLILVALVLVVVIFFPLTDIVAKHDIHGIPFGQRAAQFLTAVDSARDQIFQVCAGVLAIAGFAYTARSFQLNREQGELNRQTLELGVQGQMTERFEHAVSQIGSSKREVRIGGIYALERLAVDSQRVDDKAAVIEIIAAFLLNHARTDDAASHPSGLPEVRAAMTVIARRDRSIEYGQISLRDLDLSGLHQARGAYLGNIDFTGTRLTGAKLTNVDFTGAVLDGVKLSGADLSDANLSGVSLANSELDGAILTGAQFPRADLRDASLKSAKLGQANLAGAKLMRARLGECDLAGARLIAAEVMAADFTAATLTGAELQRLQGNGAIFDNARLDRADLTDADLTGAQLTEAKLSDATCTGCTFTDAHPYDADFDGADLTGVNLLELSTAGAKLQNAIVGTDAALPPNWVRNPLTRRLERTSTDRRA